MQQHVPQRQDSVLEYLPCYILQIVRYTDARRMLVQASPIIAIPPPRTASNPPRASRRSIAGDEPRRPARGVLCQPPCLTVSPRAHRQHDVRTSRTANGLRRLQSTVLRARTSPNGRRGRWPKAKYSCCDFVLFDICAAAFAYLQSETPETHDFVTGGHGGSIQQM